MKAAILGNYHEPLTIAEIGIDKPRADEVLIRTRATGVCHSDLHIVDGAFPAAVPIVLGHESAGVVEAVGEEVRNVEIGDHVITCLSGFCGHCEDCLTGHLSLCDARVLERPKGSPPRFEPPPGVRRLHQMAGIGGFAEVMLVNERACVAVRPDMPFDRAAVIGCAVTTGVGAVIHTAKVEPGSTVAVIGCGGVGLMVINGALIAGATRIIAIDRVPAKLELARVMGATDVIDATGADAVQAVLELTKGGVHHAFEAIGLKSTTEQAVKMLRRGGAATIVGVPPIGTKLEIDSVDLLMERRLQGSYMGSNIFPVDMPRYVDLYMQGRLHLDELISQRMPLEAINDAFTELRTGRTARSVIEFAA